MIILLPTFISILMGLMFLMADEPENRKQLVRIALGAMIINGAVCIGTIILYPLDLGITWFMLTDDLPVFFRFDMLGKVFAMISVIIWLAAGIFSLEYMKHEKHELRYYGFYFIVMGIIMGLCCSGNMVTFYACFELLTLTSMPLVLHNQSHKAVMAGLKYMFYSFAGAYMVLYGLYVLYKNAAMLDFHLGGSVSQFSMVDSSNMLLIVALLMVIGFGVKAGMFPMHAWLPTAHPVAPGPASAFLSAIIVKAGVLGIIRVIYYMFGPEFIRGTWVQYTWLTLTLITVFMGSMLAYREKVFKKRLAYSTVSQVSYILFGLAIMTSQSFTGAILHVTGHAIIKCILFLTAGAFIFKTGKTNVDDYRGIGKKMPVTLWCYTIAALGLIGIPPTIGFVSKWYLAEGALDSGIKIFAYLGPVVLLISALLTAGYLLPITMKGFFPGKDFEVPEEDKKSDRAEASLFMLIPLVFLATLTVVAGMFPASLTDMFSQIISSLGM